VSADDYENQARAAETAAFQLAQLLIETGHNMRAHVRRRLEASCADLGAVTVTLRQKARTDIPALLDALTRAEAHAERLAKSLDAALPDCCLSITDCTGAHDNGDPAHICCRARSALSAYKEDKA